MLLSVINSVGFCIAQTTYNPSVLSQNNKCTIESVTLTETETIVKIKVPQSNKLGGWVRFSSSTVLVPVAAWDINQARRINIDFKKKISSGLSPELYALAVMRKWRQYASDEGFLIRSLGNNKLDTKYKTNKSDLYFTLHFDKLPAGIQHVYIRELQDDGFEWFGIVINNKRPDYFMTPYNDSITIKQK